MLDDATTGTSAPLPHCMWCSAELPSDSEVTCPSCGATLIGEGESQVPGVTAIDAEAIVRGARAVKARPRSRLMSWISGEYEDDSDQPAPPGSLSPPPPEVRREILRLELEAQVANLQAEAGAMAAEAAVESGVPIEFPGPATPDAAAPTPDAPATPDAAPAVDAAPSLDTAPSPAEDNPTA
jgi:hypothetical protein